MRLNKVNILEFAFLVSTLSSWFFVKIAINPLRKLLPDIPNSRSSHSRIVPRGGGLVVVLVSSILGIFFGTNAFIYPLPIALIGLLDDYFNISRKVRFAIQIITVIYMFFDSYLFLEIFSNLNNLLALFVSCLILVSGVAIINFINFIDGIDGLVTGTMLVLISTSALLLDSSFILLSGSLLGFLYWNWHPAKIFLGDVGSTYLGTFYLWILLNTNNYESTFAILLMGSVILSDALFCVIRRFIDGQNIFNPHSCHLYQRLVKSGLKHSSVSIIYILSTLLISLSYLFGNLIIEFISAFLVLLLGIFLEIKVAKPFKA